MSEDVAALKDRFLTAVDAAPDVAALDAVRVEALGKKGALTALMRTLGALDPDARKAAGAELNAAKTAVSDAVDARKALLANAALDAKLTAETLDLS
ncbi:MAG: phenylalanine--tRNA ligase subunit alpha, partial [Pseudomonadota bacterium]